MQVTGNNITQNKELSILIRTDGLSFYIPTESGYETVSALSIEQVKTNLKSELLVLREKYNPSEKIRVVISTDKSVVIPTELYVRDNANSYFTLKGITINFEEDYIITSQNEACTYIWLYDREVIDTINLVFKEVVYIHTLELSQLYGERLSLKFKNSVFLVSKEDNLITLVVFKNKTMLFQEIIEVKSSSDTIFYIKSILSNYSFKRRDNIIMLGDKNDKLIKILQNFSSTISTIGYFESI